MEKRREERGASRGDYFWGRHGGLSQWKLGFTYTKQCMMIEPIHQLSIIDGWGGGKVIFKRSKFHQKKKH